MPQKDGSSSQQETSPSAYDSPPVRLKPSHFLSMPSGSPNHLQVHACTMVHAHT